MKGKAKTKEQLTNELAELQKKVSGLEAKAAEFKQTEELFRKKEKRYDLALKASQDGMWEWNIKTGEDYWSPQFKKLMGYQDNEIEASFEKWEAMLHPDDRQQVLDILKSHITEHKKLNQEFRLKTKTGDYRWFCSRGQARRDAKGKAIRVVGSIRDITDIKRLELELKESYNELENKIEKRTAELKTANEKLRKEINEHMQAEEALKKSEEKYYMLIEQANDAIISVNAAGVIMGFNKRAEQMFGYSREEMLGKSSDLLVAKKNREKQKVELEKLEEAGAEFNKDQNIFEGIGVSKDGKEFNVEFSFYIVEVNGEIIATSSIRDISERKVAEQKLIDYQERLKALTSQLTLSEEKERRRFAEYLHDEIGQYLFASQLQIEQLKTALVSEEQVKALDKVLDNIKQVLDNSRSLTFELSSPILYELGLEKALEWLAEHTGKQYNMTVVFEDDKQEKPLEDDMKIFLYQAVRELLTNVAKHAQTQKASVSVKKVDSTIQIWVEDNGVGFNIPHQHSSEDRIKGFGLFRINERLEQLGGQFELESQPNQGTTITIVAPLSVNGVKLA